MGGGEMAGLTYEPKRVREAMRAYGRLRDENAKLRDLVADMLTRDVELHWQEFRDRAEALGIEVGL